MIKGNDKKEEGVGLDDVSLTGACRPRPGTEIRVIRHDEPVDASADIPLQDPVGFTVAWALLGPPREGDHPGEDRRSPSSPNALTKTINEMVTLSVFGRIKHDDT